MIFGAAPEALPGALHFDPARWSPRLADWSAPDGRHLVLRENAILHRVWLRNDDDGLPLAAMIPFDDMVDLRLQAAAEIHRWFCGRPTSYTPAACPTEYQAQRLRLLLAILDLRADAKATSHEVARRLIYPRLSIGRGAAWKSSPERRRTQRLIREAEAMMRGGYLALLGHRQVRQK